MRPFKTILKLRLARALAIPRPIPLNEPVTMATLLVDLRIEKIVLGGDEGFFDVVKSFHRMKIC